MTRCCKTIERTVDSHVPFQMHVLDWYDGPSTAVFVCSACLRCFRGFMVDWSKDHRERVFALSPLNNNVDTRKLLSDLALFRMVDPSTTNDALFQNGELESFGAPEFLVGWRSDEGLVGVSGLFSFDDIENARGYLLESDSTRSPVDWHSRLFGNLPKDSDEQSDEPKCSQ